MTTPDDLRKNILSTYFTLRMGIVVLSVAFPIVLAVGGQWFGGVPELATSMSAYYGEHGGVMRDWFVGILVTIGSFLYLYKGFSPLENVLLNAAGGFAVATALVPCHCWTDAASPGNPWHAVVAVSFFVAMALVCLLCATETVALLPKASDQTAFKRRYRAIGAVLLLSPAAAVIVSYALAQPTKYRFFIEAFGVWTFAYYWWTKSREFRITQAEERALHGALRRERGRGVVPAA